MPRCWILSIVAMALMSLVILTGCSDDSVRAGWSQTYGGPDWENGQSVKQTSDGGYIVLGHTMSYGSGDKDIYLIKTNSRGDTLWTKTFGGPGTEYGRSVQQTSDGGYVVLGEYTMGSNLQCWLIKTSANGTTEWDRLYGRDNCQEHAAEVQQTSDGGYILIGTTDRGGDNDDIWLVKTYADGTTQWYDEKGYDDSDQRGASIRQTSDGGYILAGTSYHVDSHYGNVWLVKIKPNGSNEWYRDFGGEFGDYTTSVRQTTDGGYVILSYAERADGQAICLYKTDAGGNQVWERDHRGAAMARGYQVQQTTDGGYMIAGDTGIYREGHLADFFLIKTDAAGTALWTKTYGGSGDDNCCSGQQTADGGYILCGSTDSQGAGFYDIFVVKTDPDGEVE
jgi:hypothetical protein